MNSSDKNSFIRLGEHRRSNSISQASLLPPVDYPTQGNKLKSVTQSIDRRIEWTYSSLLNSRIQDVSSVGSRFPNQMLTDYINYIYRTYNIEDPVQKYSRNAPLRTDSNKFRTPSKSFLNNDAILRSQSTKYQTVTPLRESLQRDFGYVAKTSRQYGKQIQILDDQNSPREIARMMSNAQTFQQVPKMSYMSRGNEINVLKGRINNTGYNHSSENDEEPNFNQLNITYQG